MFSTLLRQDQSSIVLLHDDFTRQGARPGREECLWQSPLGTLQNSKKSERRETLYLFQIGHYSF